MPHKDPEDRRSYARAYYKRRVKSNPDYAINLRRKNKQSELKRRELVDTVIAEWKARGCNLCSETAICCLVAHHLDPSQKEFAISVARAKGYALQRIKDELKKCVCLCINCHSKVHAVKKPIIAG